jgi:hypothetical protein
MKPEQFLRDPKIQRRLAKVGAPSQRPNASPTLTEECLEAAVGTKIGAPGGEQGGGAVCAEARLARTHPQSRVPANVVKADSSSLFDGLLNAPVQDQLTLAQDSSGE